MKRSPASPLPTGRLAAEGTALPRKTGSAPSANSCAAGPTPSRPTRCKPAWLVRRRPTSASSPHPGTAVRSILAARFALIREVEKAADGGAVRILRQRGADQQFLRALALPRFAARSEEHTSELQ